MAENSTAAYYCSFCGKRDDEIEVLIAGPTVFICDECVVTSMEIVTKNRAETSDIEHPALRKPWLGDIAEIAK